MTDFFFQMGLSNACFSLALAIVAMVVGAKVRRPHLAHMLWLLVFIKLVTPPIVTIPIITIPQQPETAVAVNEHSRPGPPLANSRQFDSVSSRIGPVGWNHARVWLPPIWLLGSVVVFAWSMVRVCRFSRLLAAESDVAPQELQTAAVKIARRLELNTIPTICTTSARISPMVWWTGGKVRIVIPTNLLDQMDAQQWQWILAHELAHVRRRDYLVRWLEWSACVLFWWNPVVWWAQRNLRAMEEICCDDLVMSCLNPKPKFYANSLLSAVEFLARPVLRPPAMASEINSGGFLERRFKMIVSNKSNQSNSRWLQVCVLLFAMVVLPFGIASAQDYKAVERRLGEAVSNGELSLEQAGLMLEALKKAGGARKDQGADRAEAYLMKVKKELGELVEAGSISREDAAKRYEGAKKGLKARMAGRGERQRGDDKQREYEGFERRIKAAVREGKMTREEAGEKLEGFRRRMEMAERGERGERRISREDYGRIEAELKKAVAEGKISKEQARARLDGLRSAMAGDRGGRDDGMMRQIVGALAEAGIEREQIRDVMGAMERIVGGIRAEGNAFELNPGMLAHLELTLGLTDEQIELVVGLSQRLAAAGEGENRERGEVRERGDARTDWDAIRHRIEGAVESGDMTREQADAKYKEIKEKLSREGRRGDKRGEYEGFERRIKAAVEAGKMTREQAREKLEGYKKRIGR